MVAVEGASEAPSESPVHRAMPVCHRSKLVAVDQYEVGVIFTRGPLAGAAGEARTAAAPTAGPSVPTAAAPVPAGVQAAADAAISVPEAGPSSGPEASTQPGVGPELECLRCSTFCSRVVLASVSSFQAAVQSSMGMVLAAFVLDRRPSSRHVCWEGRPKLRMLRRCSQNAGAMWRLVLKPD